MNERARVCEARNLPLRRAALGVLGLAACGRVGFGASGGDAGRGDTGGDGIGDGVTFVDGVVPTAACGSTIVLDEGFDDAVPGPSFMMYAGNGLTVTESVSRLAIAYAASVPPGRFAGYNSTATFTVEGSCVIAEVDELPVNGALIFFKLSATTTQVEFAAAAGILELRTHVNGTVNLVGTADPAARFWRLRQQGGITFWDTSVDSVDYQQHASSAVLAASTVALELGAGTVQSTSNGGTAAFARVQIIAP